jgi:hypothetical protein
MADESTGSLPSTPAAAPAVSSSSGSAAPAATTTPTDVKRPANFRDALRQAEKEESSSSTPASGETDAAAATVLPTDAGSAATEGPVPYSRFSEVNTAKKAAEARLKEIESRLSGLSWADGVDPRVVADSVRWRARAHNDIEGFLNDIVTSAPPERQSQVRNALARLMQAQRPDTEPQPDIQTDTGQPVYSAKQQAAWYQWQSRQQEAKWQQRLAPLEQELARGRQVREQAARDHENHTFAVGTAKEANDWPHFKEHAAEIVEELQKFPPGETQEREKLHLYNAYVTVLKRTVLPGLSGKTEAAVLANLKTKATASSEHPGRAASAPTSRPRSMGDALRKELAKAGVR